MSRRHQPHIIHSTTGLSKQILRRVWYHHTNHVDKRGTLESVHISPSSCSVDACVDTQPWHVFGSSRQFPQCLVCHNLKLFPSSLDFTMRCVWPFLLFFLWAFKLCYSSYQPNYIPIEATVARKQLGSVSLPLGSPWCDGKPVFWLVGHQPGDTERPWCLEVNNDQGGDFMDYDYTNSTWKLSPSTVMDRQDILNEQDGPRNIDRHDCVTIDVNFDETMDVVCGVGANKGKGFGYNEVYLTDPVTGNLSKILHGHGLNRWPTMRNRIMITLKAADGFPMVLLAADGRPRTDGLSNIHRMFKLLPDPTKQHGVAFKHVPGPWNRHSIANCLQKVDVNQDGLDDILLCQNRKCLHSSLCYVFTA